jgi:hypothetical protein
VCARARSGRHRGAASTPPDTFSAHSPAPCCPPALPPQELRTVLWACFSLGLTPPSAWQAACVAALRTVCAAATGAPAPLSVAAVAGLLEEAGLTRVLAGALGTGAAINVATATPAPLPTAATAPRAAAAAVAVAVAVAVAATAPAAYAGVELPVGSV